MSFCLPKEETSKLLKAIGDGSFSPDKYAEKTSTEERRAYVEQFVGKDNAKEVNTMMEQKMLLKDWQRGMVTAVKNITGLSEASKRDFVARINNMKEMLSPADEKSFYSDITEKKLGVGVSMEESKKIFDLARTAQAAHDAPTKNLSGVSDEYLKAADDLRSYIASLKPTTALASIGKNAAIIARNNLLMNPSTPVKTTVGQLVNSGMDMITRRIGAFSLKGLNYDLVRQANSEAWVTFQKTGLNTASMESLDDTGKLGEGNRFAPSTGMDSKNKAVAAVESTVRTVAKISNKIAIDWEHNYTFTKFYQTAFFDMGNIFSSNIAKSEGLTGPAAQARAAEIFKDAARVVPKTAEGAMTRQVAQANAARITSTNNTFIGNLSISVKDALNKQVTGLGDALMPIAKIPSNIIWNGIENAGVGIPLGVKDIFQGRVKMQSSDMALKYQGAAQFASGIQKVARTVGVLSAAAYFSSTLTKQDFKSDRYGATYVKIGGTWVNMEYFNAVSPALAGMMNVRKNEKTGQGVLNTTGQYVAGATGGLKNAPLIGDLNGLVNAITTTNYAKGIQKYANTFFTSRGEPAFIRQLRSGQGIKGLFFSSSGLPTQEELKKLGAK